MFNGLKKLFAQRSCLDDPSNTPLRRMTKKEATQIFEKRLRNKRLEEAIPALNLTTQEALAVCDRINQKHQEHETANAAALTSFWAEVRTAAETKIGAKLSDKVWSDETVREKWRQRLNMVRP